VPPFEFVNKTIEHQELGYIGSVTDVINGRMESTLNQKIFHAPDYKHGFEVASPINIHSIGESLLTNGLCYTNSTAAKNKHSLLYGEDFVTNGIFLIPKSARPNAVLKGDWSKNPIPINALYETIQNKFKTPFTFVGLIRYQQINTFAISKAPVYNEHIFTHEAEYYADGPEFFDSPTDGFIMGAAANYNDQQFSSLHKKLRVVLYDSPLDRKAGLLSMHAHTLLLNNPIEDPTHITPKDVLSVKHVLSKQTFISHCEVDIYLIKDLINLIS
jgi:hypothetical protein